MTSIDPHHRLAVALQKTGSLQERKRTAGASSGPASRAGSETAAQVLAQRLGSLDPADPQRREKAVRVYLESSLAREFGTDLLNDPAFTQMVDAVQSQMQEDPEIAAAMQAAADLLLSGTLPA